MLDAVTANFEEKRFFRDKDCLHVPLLASQLLMLAHSLLQQEVILYSFAIGSVWTFFTIAATGELQEALKHSATRPEV